MPTKGDLINLAYSKGRISGITSQPTPEDITLALDTLENMAAMFEGLNICTGYNFEDEPDINSLHNLERKYRGPYISNLAFWILTNFGKQPMQALVLEQQRDYSFLSASTAKTRQVAYPVRHPRGSGNTLRYNRYQRFYRTQPEAPNSCATNDMFIDDIDDFTEHFDSYLNDGETIDSYTIESDNGLAILSDSLTTPDIDYRIRADGNSDNRSNSLLQVTIVATTSSGRVTTRIVDFALFEVTTRIP